jgi:trk system potassium uptake protein TrkA
MLADKGGSVIAIDNKSELIEKVKDTVTQAIYLDSTDEEAMNQVPFEDIDIAIVAIGDNIEASIISTAILKKIGVPYILARAITDIHHQVLRQVGADEIISIGIDEGKRVAQRLISPEILDRFPITGSISVGEVYVPKQFVGKNLKELDLRNKMRINVVSIKRNTLSVDEMGNSVQNEEVVFPGPAETLEETDTLLVVGKNEDIDAFRDF